MSAATLKITHSLEQNHFDALVPFDTAAGWEKYYDPDGRSPKPVDWWPAPEAPSRATSQNGTVKYRYRMKWKTGAITSFTEPNAVSVKLLGHNGAHHVSLADVDGVAGNEVVFASYLGAGSEIGRTTGAAANKAATVKNLTIRSVSPAEQFIVLPRATGGVPFVVQLDDFQSNKAYSISISIRRTTRPTEIVKTISQTRIGLRQTLIWNYRNNQDEMENIEGGYFTFDVKVEKAGDSPQTYRSAFLNVVEDALSLTFNDQNDFQRNESGQYKTEFRYKLNEAPQAESVNVGFYQNLIALGGESGLSDTTRWDAPISQWLSLTGSPTARAIIQAKDMRKTEYRKHQNKPMLNWNKGFLQYQKQMAMTLTLTGTRDAPFVEWNRFKWYRSDNLNDYIITPWQKVNNWTVNSGPDVAGLINSDLPVRHWSAGGAIPLCNPNDNNVRQNPNNHWNINITYTQGGYFLQNRVRKTESSFRWKNFNGTNMIFLRDGKSMVRTWRFRILNESGGDKHYPNSPVPNATKNTDGTEKSVHRKWLRVHDDGVGPGSDGCSAVPNGIMPEVWNRFKQIQHAKEVSDGSDNNWLPYEVYDHNGVPATGPTNYIYWWTASR